MRVLMVLFATFICVTSTAAQSAKEMAQEIEGKYSIDDNGNVTFVSIIDAPGLSKDDIFLRAQNYFTYNYVSGKAVVQTNDKEHGVLVGKGVYPKVHIGSSIITTTIDTWHILRVDVKDNRARAIITLLEYDRTFSGGSNPSNSTTVSISSQYPINPKGMQKTVMMKAFYKSYQKAMATLENLKKAILEGSTSKEIENSDW